MRPVLLTHTMIHSPTETQYTYKRTLTHAKHTLMFLI